jgi:hypothetical protein
MKLSTEQELALRAALLPAPENTESWNSLVKMTPVMELDGSITRIMPALYQNLGGAKSLSGAQKLKGSYLFAWAKNTEFISNINPLLILLEESGINYRILKGGALNFLFQSLGTRSMGDIDVLVGKKDLDSFQKILEKVGFRKKFADACPHIRSGNSDPELNYVNSKNIEIDLHVMESRRPKLLFSLLLETPPVICEFMGIKIKIPPPELLIMHSIHHGQIGVQTSDEIQSLLDVRRLIDFANVERLQEFSNKLHFDALLDTYLQKLARVTGEASLLRISQGNHLWNKVKYSQDQALEILARLREYPSIRKSRSISSQKLLRVFKDFRGHRVAYCLWLYTSKLRQVERLFCLSLHGFLKKPSRTLRIAPGVEYSVNNDHGEVTFNSSASLSQDWRFSFLPEIGRKRLKLSMRSESFKVQSFLVFVNGMVLGVTDKNIEGVHSLELLHPSSQIEISMRLPMNGCEDCAQKLEDLTLQFD